jgi:hypothetical protein
MRGWKNESVRHSLSAKGISTNRHYNATRPFSGVVNLVGYKPTTSQAIVKDVQEMRKRRAAERDAAAENFLEESQMRQRALSGIGKSSQLSAEEQANVAARTKALATGQKFEYVSPEKEEYLDLGEVKYRLNKSGLSKNPDEYPSGSVENSPLEFKKVYGDVPLPDTDEYKLVGENLVPNESRKTEYVGWENVVQPVVTKEEVEPTWLDNIKQLKNIRINVVKGKNMSDEPRTYVIENRLSKELKPEPTPDFLNGKTRFSEGSKDILRRNAQRRAALVKRERV